MHDALLYAPGFFWAHLAAGCKTRRTRREDATRSALAYPCITFSLRINAAAPGHCITGSSELFPLANAFNIRDIQAGFLHVFVRLPELFI